MWLPLATGTREAAEIATGTLIDDASLILSLIYLSIRKIHQKWFDHKNQEELNKLMEKISE